MKRKTSQAVKGQILIVMALMSTTLIILFGMVVAIGHLVQAKVNLQNAVDLAAMSGASWQARYLNHIALVNYRMRQNYKFVLYDLYVTQSRFNNGFRKEVASRNPSSIDAFDLIPRDGWILGICQQMQGYHPISKIGESGSATAQGTDMCRNVDASNNYIPPIVPSPIVGLNPFLIAANIAITQLSQAARQVCRDSSGQNEAYFRYIMRNLEERQSYQMSLLQNILVQFASSFQPGQPAYSSIQNTFRQNLISANENASVEIISPEDSLAPSGISNMLAQFREMFTSGNPPQSDFTRYFEVLQSFFRIQVVNITVNGSGGCQFGVKAMNYPERNGSGRTLGTFLGLGRARVSGDGRPGSMDPQGNAPKVPFGLALRATAKPHLLFWPSSLTPTLVAVAAAKPFGSRIGPPKWQSDMEVSGGQALRSADGTNLYPLANMMFYPGDVAVGNQLPGIGHRKILSYLYHALPNPRMGTNEDRPSIEPAFSCDSRNPNFLCLALAPTVYESLFWSVMPFPSGSGTRAPGPQVLNALFPNDVPALDLAGANVADDDKYTLWDRMPTRASRDANARWHYTFDELGSVEEFHVNRRAVFFADRNLIKSSWSPDWSPSDTNGVNGRFGYQIKLTSLGELCGDIQAGGDGRLLGQLQNSDLRVYCESGNPAKVYH